MTLRKTNASNGNVLVMFGGGMVDCACIIVRELAQAIYEIGTFNKTFVGFYSFRSLTESGLIREWTEKLSNESKYASSGFFGTCRETNFVRDEDLMAKAIETCKSYDITHIILAGGDGSSHHMAGIAERFYEHGICWIFALPMTLDGINGGLSLGLKSAVNASINVITHVSSTSLRTLEGNKYPAIVFELQGRNRDDILLSVLRELTSQKKIADFALQDIAIIAIPTNLPTNTKNLERRLSAISKDYSSFIKGRPTLILLSEGAELTATEIVNMAKNAEIKMRYQPIGYLSQLNGMTSEEEKLVIHMLASKIAQTVSDQVEYDMVTEPFSIVFEKETSDAIVTDYRYFAFQNPQDHSPQRFEIADYVLLRKYMV